MKHVLLFAFLSLLLLSGCAKNSAESSSETVPAVTEEPPFSSQYNAESDSESVLPESEETDPELPFSYSVTNGEAWIYSYTGEETEIEIPSRIGGAPVTKLSGTLFSDSGVKRVTLPETLVDISPLRFCEVVEVVLPAGMDSLKPQWFEGFQKLESFTITGEGAYRTEGGIIYSADGKTLVLAPNALSGEFAVPEGVEQIGEKAFRYTQISRIVFPSSVRSIGNEALCCDSLESAVFSEGLEEIGENAFYNTPLREAELPLSLKRIGDRAFMSSKLERVTLHEGLESLGSSAFNGAKLSELYIPETLTECGHYPVGADKEVRVSLPSFDGIFAELADSPNAFLRSGTLLENALHNASLSFDAEIKLFTDLTGDGFPEMLCSNYGILFCYCYSESDGWVQLFSSDSIMLCEEDESGERFLLSETGEYYYYMTRVRYSLTESGIDNDPIVYESHLNANLWGEEPTDSFADVPPYHVIKEFNVNSIVEEYGLNGVSLVYCERFASEPFGEPVEWLEINGGRVSEFPYAVFEIPEKLWLNINGEDILHGGEMPEGVSFDYWTHTLTLDNAKLHSEDGECIDVNFREKRYGYLQIKLIGECEALSANSASISSNASLRFIGSGSLSTCGINAAKDEIEFVFSEDVKVTDSAGITNPSMIRLSGNAQVETSSISRNNFVTSGKIDMNDSSRLVVGNEQLDICAISDISSITMNRDSRLEVASDSYAISTCEQIGVYNSASLDTRSRYGIIASHVQIYHSASLSTEILDVKSVRIYGGRLECREKLILDEVVSPYANPSWHFGEVAVYGRSVFRSGETEWSVEEVDPKDGTNATPTRELRKKLTVEVQSQNSQT